MDMKQVQREELRDKVITIRTFNSYSKWMKDNRVRPSKVFNTALKELMKKQGSKNGK